MFRASGPIALKVADAKASVVSGQVPHHQLTAPVDAFDLSSSEVMAESVVPCR